MIIYSSDYDYPVYYGTIENYDVREFYDEPYYDDDDYCGDYGYYDD